MIQGARGCQGTSCGSFKGWSSSNDQRPPEQKLGLKGGCMRSGFETECGGLPILHLALFTKLPFTSLQTVSVWQLFLWVHLVLHLGCDQFGMPMLLQVLSIGDGSHILNRWVCIKAQHSKKHKRVYQKETWSWKLGFLKYTLESVAGWFATSLSNAGWCASPSPLCIPVALPCLNFGILSQVQT